MCGAIALATFLVDAFGIRYNVVANERSVASARRHKYVAFASDSSGSGVLSGTMTPSSRAPRQRWPKLVCTL